MAATTGVAGAAPELLAACWTSAGDVMPARGPDTSPLDIRTRIEAVGRAGYTGFGLAHADLVVARDTVGLPAVASMLADNGITVVQLERLAEWYATGEARARADLIKADIFEACPILGVDNIKVGTDEDDAPGSYNELCAGFDALCDEAREVGVKIGFENTPFSLLIRTTEQLITFVTDVANPNGGVILDIWHAYRGGTSYADIAATLPPAHLFGVELDDGVAEVVGTHLEDTFDNRLPCGMGTFDVPDFILAVRSLGWTGPWGVEHMSVAHRALPIDEALARARDGVLDCLAAADRIASGTSGNAAETEDPVAQP